MIFFIEKRKIEKVNILIIYLGASIVYNKLRKEINLEIRVKIWRIE